MANKTERITLSFNADTSDARAELNKLKRDLTSFSTGLNPIGKNGAWSSEIEKSIDAAARLKGVLEQATDPISGKLNLQKLREAFDASGMSLTEFNKQLSKTPDGTRMMNDLCNQIQNTDKNINVLTDGLNKFFKGLKNTAMWTIQSTAIHAVQSALSGAYSYAQKLDKNLNDIRIVTGYSADKMADFAVQANKAAKALSATTNEYVRGSLIYYQAGLSDEAVIERTNTTIKMAQTSGEAVEDISSYMTAIWNNFADGSKEVEYYADVISYLGAKTAASNAQIAEGMQSFAAIADTVGLSYEYAAAALTTVIDKTQQSSSIVGNAFKTIFSRLESLKLGETLEDGVDLNKYSQALEVVGVNVLDTTGNLKDMDTVLDELSVQWDKMTQAQKIALAETVGGVRQYNNLISLLDNYDYFKELVSGSNTSSGYLQEQSEIYADSWEAASNRVRASWESVYKQIINDKFFIKLADITSKIVDTISEMIKGLGGVKGLIPAIFLVVDKITSKTTILSDNLNDIIRSLKNITHIVEETAKNENLQKEAGVNLINNSDPRTVKDYANLSDVIKEYSQLEDDKKDMETWEYHYKKVLLDSSLAQIKRNASLQEEIEIDEKLIDLRKKLGDKAGLLDTKEAQIGFSNIELSRTIQNNIDSLKDKNGVYNKTHVRAKARRIYDEDYEGLDLWSKSRFKELSQTLNKDKQMSLIKSLQSHANNKLDSGKSIFTDLFSEEKVKILKEEMLPAAEKLATEAQNENLSKEEANIKLQEAVQLRNSIVDASQDNADLDEETKKQLLAQKEILDEIIKNRNGIADKQVELNSGGYWVTKNTENAGTRDGGKSKTTADKVLDYTRLASTAFMAQSSIDGLLTSLSDGTATVRSFATSVTGAVSGIGGLASVMKTLGIVTKGALGWAALIVVGLEAVIKLIEYLISQTLDSKIKKQTEEVQNLEHAVEGTKNAYQDLKSTLEDLDGAYSVLNNMTAGTAEWRREITELNKEARELIDTYDLSDEDWYRDGNGLIHINERGQEKAEQKALDDIDNAETALAAGKMRLIDLQQQKNVRSMSGYGAGYYYEQKQSSPQSPSYGSSTAYSSSYNTTLNQQKKTEFDNALDLITKRISEGTFSFGSEDYIQDLKDMGISDSIIDIISSNENLRNALEDNGNKLGDNTEALKLQVEDQIYNKLSSSSAFQNLSAEDKQLIADTYGDDIIKRASERAEEYSNRNWTLEEREQFALASGWKKDDASGTWVDSNGQAAKLTDIQSENLANWKALNDIIEETVSNLQGKSTSQLETEANEIKKGRRYSLEELNGGIKNTQFNYGKEGLDGAELSAYNEMLQDTFEENNKAIASGEEELEEYKDQIKATAQANMQFNVGLEDLVDNFEDYSKTLNNTKKNSSEYAKTIKSLRDDLSRMLDVNGADLSEEFLTSKENLDLMKQAANGSTEAITQLRENAALEFVPEVPENATEEVTQDFNNLIDQIKNSEEFEDLEIGASLDDTAFIETLNNMLLNGNMSVEEIQKVLNSLGFEPTIEYEEVPFDSKTMATKTVYSRDEDGNEIQLTNTADIAEGTMVLVPKINGSKTTYRGSPKAITNASVASKAKNNAKENKPKQSRYHENNARLDMISKEMERVNNLESRAYGNDKLALMDKKNDLLEQQAKRYQALADEARSYLSGDAGKLKGYGFEFNEDGTIKNYDKVYSAMSKETQEAVDELVSNYETALNTAIDNTEKAAEAMRQILDNKLAMVQYAVEVKLALDENSLKIFDFLLNQAKKDATDVAKILGLIGDEIATNQSKIETYRKGIHDIMVENHGISEATFDELINSADPAAAIAEILKDNEFTADEIKALQDYASNLIDCTQALIDLREQGYEAIGDALEEYNKQLDENIDKIDKEVNVLKSLKNIIDIIGEDTLGITSEMIRQMSKANLTAAQNSARIAKDTLDMNEAALKQLEEYKAKNINTLSEEEMRLVDEQIKEQEKRWEEARQDWVDKWEDACQAAADYFHDMTKQSAKDFSEVMGGVYGDINKLREVYNQRKEIDDLYLDDYEKIYELNKLNRDITNSIDNTDNILGKQKLLELQTQLNEMQREGVEVNAWDVEVMQKKYDLYLAQIALEEAQNAKNQVRMSQDSEGNWSYIYTADDSAINGAQQSYEDKLFALEDSANKHIEDMENLILEKLEAYYESMDGLEMSEQERMERLEEYYNTLIENYGIELEKAVDLSTWITEEFNVNDHNLINSFDETRLAFVYDIETIDEFMALFNETSKTMLAEITEYFRQWAIDVDETMLAAGTSTTGFKEVFQEQIQDVEDKSDEAAENAGEMAGRFEREFYNIIADTQSLHDQYSGYMDAIMTKNVQLAQNLNQLERTYAGVATSMVQKAYDIVDACKAAAAAAAAIGADIDLTTPTNNNKTTKYQVLDIISGNVIGTYNTRAEAEKVANVERGGPGTGLIRGTIKEVSMDTGGYTGEWGNSGRIALLHQKELVLNAEDTENFLGAMDILHNIVNAIDINAQSQGMNLGQMISNAVTNTSQTLDQNVTIHAEFPNAVDHTEIEQAFDNLVNKASQYANRK